MVASQINSSPTSPTATIHLPRIFPSKASPKFARAKEWARLIAITGLAQTTIQAIGFVCSILVIRLLPINEYALFTIASTMLGMMTVLADGGIASAVMSQGGQVWHDKAKLGSVIATGMALRKQFALYSLAASIPILFYLLLNQGASWTSAIIIVAALLPAFFSTLSGTILEISAKLHQDVAKLQMIQVASNVFRAFGTGVALFAFPIASSAIMVSGAAQVYANWQIRHLSRSFVEENAEENLEVRREILIVVKRILPGAIYYAVSGQVAIWLLAIYGMTEAIASVGALGRLSQILTLFITIFGLLIVPRFSRLPSLKKLLIRRFVQVQLVVFGIVAAITSLAASYPEPLLAMLGSNYSNLQNEIILQAILAGTGFAASTSYALSAARGVIFPPQILLPTLAVVQVITFVCFRLDSITAVLFFSICMQALAFVSHSGYFLLKAK